MYPCDYAHDEKIYDEDWNRNSHDVERDKVLFRNATTEYWAVMIPLQLTAHTDITMSALGGPPDVAPEAVRVPHWLPIRRVQLRIG